MPGAIVTQPRVVNFEPLWGTEDTLNALQPVLLAEVCTDIPCQWSIECVDLSLTADAVFTVECGMPRGILESSSFTTNTVNDPRLFIDEVQGLVRLVVWGTMVRVTAKANNGGNKARVKLAPLSTDFGAASLSPLLNPNKVANAATRSDVAQSAASVTLIAAVDGGGSHRGCFIYNDAAVDLFIRLGAAAASLTDFSVRIPPATVWEMPFPFYIGEIRGIWSAAGGGAARITQLKES